MTTDGLSYQDKMALLRKLVEMARAAAARRDWTTNHRLCREHDQLALELIRGRNGSQ